MPAKLSNKKMDNLIDAAYKARCSGIQIDMFDITKVFAHGRKLLLDGADKAKLEQGLFDFVESIRKN